jgi:hypothetical protein
VSTDKQHRTRDAMQINSLAPGGSFNLELARHLTWNFAGFASAKLKLCGEFPSADLLLRPYVSDFQRQKYSTRRRHVRMRQRSTSGCAQRAAKFGQERTISMSKTRANKELDANPGQCD